MIVVKRVQIDQVHFPFVGRRIFISVRRLHFGEKPECWVCERPFSACEGDDIGLLFTERGNKPACESCVGELLEQEDA